MVLRDTDDSRLVGEMTVIVAEVITEVTVMINRVVMIYTVGGMDHCNIIPEVTAMAK